MKKLGVSLQQVLVGPLGTHHSSAFKISNSSDLIERQSAMLSYKHGVCPFFAVAVMQHKTKQQKPQYAENV